jgi:hypothetical protein
MECSRCNMPATRNDGGTMHLCDCHYRIKKMRNSAQQTGKSVPSSAEIEAMIAALDGMRCPACKRTMVLHTDRGDLASVVSLQHWEDGTVGLLCQSCNTRHRSAGDERFAQISADTKSCSICKSILPLRDFNVGDGFGRRQSACRKCSRSLSLAHYYAKART